MEQKYSDSVFKALANATPSRVYSLMADLGIYDSSDIQTTDSTCVRVSVLKAEIDIQIKDAIGRYHQCATIQLDFQLPLRFNLTYMSHDGNDKTRPVIIHRAILGSVERMIAILTENFGGKWPLWLSPQQVMVIPVGPTCDEYAQKVKQQFHGAGLMADVDVDPGCTLNKKIRNAQLAQYNFILVVGEKEKARGTVNIRTRDNKIHGERTVPETVERLLQLKCGHSKNAEEEF